MRLRWVVVGAVAATCLVLVACTANRSPDRSSSTSAPVSTSAPAAARPDAGPPTTARSTSDRTSARTPAPTSRAASSTVVSSSPPADRDGIIAANKKAAAVEAGRLAQVVPIPAGSVLASSAADLGPFLDEPLTPAVVISTRWLTVPATQDDTVRWVKAHLPKQYLLAEAESKTSPDGVVEIGMGYFDDRSSTHWAGGTISVNTVSAPGKATLLRIDGMTQWTDPNPMVDEYAGKRLSVTVPGGCPASDMGVIGVKPNVAPATALLPPGRPTSGLVCAYSGSRGGRQSWRLTIHDRLDSADAVDLARRIAAVPLSHFPDPLPACAASFFVADLVVLHYASGDANLFVRADGCTEISNGRIIAAGPDISLLALPVANGWS